MGAHLTTISAQQSVLSLAISRDLLCDCLEEKLTFFIQRSQCQLI